MSHQQQQPVHQKYMSSIISSFDLYWCFAVSCVVAVHRDLFANVCLIGISCVFIEVKLLLIRNRAGSV